MSWAGIPTLERRRRREGVEIPTALPPPWDTAALHPPAQGRLSSSYKGPQEPNASPEHRAEPPRVPKVPPSVPCAPWLLGLQSQQSPPHPHVVWTPPPSEPQGGTAAAISTPSSSPQAQTSHLLI